MWSSDFRAVGLLNGSENGLQLADLEQDILSSYHTMAIIKNEIIDSCFQKGLALNRHLAITSAIAVFRHFQDSLAFLAFIILFQLISFEEGYLIDSEAYVMALELEFPVEERVRFLNQHGVGIDLTLFKAEAIPPDR